MAAQQRTYFVDQLNDPEYINWLKASRALLITVDGLRRFCQAQMKNFHQTLLFNINKGETLCTVPCSHTCRELKRNPIRISWPEDVCLKWLDGIAQERGWGGRTAILVSCPMNRGNLPKSTWTLDEKTHPTVLPILTHLEFWIWWSTANVSMRCLME